MLRLKHKVALDRGQVRSKGLAKLFMNFREVTQRAGLTQFNRWRLWLLDLTISLFYK